MSWDGYIDNLKALGVQVAGLFGRENGAVWATRSDWPVTQAEMNKVLTAMRTGVYPEDGLDLDGCKYAVINSSASDALTLKGKKAITDNGAYLIHIALGEQCVVAGGIAGNNERSAAKHVEQIRDYLRNAGY